MSHRDLTQLFLAPLFKIAKKNSEPTKIPIINEWKCKIHPEACIHTIENIPSKKKKYRGMSHMDIHENMLNESPACLTHACNRSTLEAEVGDSQVWGQPCLPGLHSKALSLKELSEGLQAEKQILHDSIYMKCPEKEIYIWRKGSSDCRGLGVGTEMNCTGTRGSFRDHGSGPVWTVEMITQPSKTAATP